MDGGEANHQVQVTVREREACRLRTEDLERTARPEAGADFFETDKDLVSFWFHLEHLAVDLLAKLQYVICQSARGDAGEIIIH